MLKKLIAVILSALMVLSLIPSFSAAESADEKTALPSFVTDATTGLFAHGATSNVDTEAWQMWQNKMEEENKEDREDKKMIDVDTNIKYFFMPNGSSDHVAQIYNGYDESVTINNTVIPAKSIGDVSYKINENYAVTINGKTYTLIFKKSSAEAAVYVNNTAADGNGTELYSYLCKNKSNSASATAAIVNRDGSVDNTSVKKIKGRGNSTWKKLKKPFNITYSDKVTIDGMGEGKKFSLLANYQDGSLVRNRLLYDLSDAVGMPYASDSRFVDLYMNGVYYGSYQLAQKIEVGSSDVVNDIDDEAYLNSDGSIAENFPFLVEIDPSASSDDYTVKTDNNTALTIKAPEIDDRATGYEEVKNFVKTKFTELYRAITITATTEQLDAVMDIDSFAKIYLINELSKNWDSGVSSFYMVYKQDENGNWKFFASPVWDYDNSLGNALGVSYDFNRMGTTQEEYLLPTGWWCKYKKYSASSSTFNIVNRLAKCTALQEYSAQVWFNEFIPALHTFSSENINSGEIYSSDVYYNLLKGTADCNYTRGWFLDTNNNWIADHTKLYRGNYDTATKKFTTATTATTYPETFEGEYNYAIDWMLTRAAWLSSEFVIIGDTNGDGIVDEKDSATEPEVPTEPTTPTEPSTPEESIATTTTITNAKSKSTSSIKLNWTTVADAKSYDIYQQKSGEDFKKIKTIVGSSNVSCTLTNLKAGTVYSYKIKAQYSDGETNYYSDFSNVVTTATKPQKAKLKKAVANSGKSARLTWKKVSGASGYAIYKKSGNKWIAAKNVNKNTNTAVVKKLKKNTKNIFRIKAFVKVGSTKIYGKYSNKKSVFTYALKNFPTGYYKQFPNMPDFGCVTKATLAKSVRKKNTSDGKTFDMYFYMYYPDTVKDGKLLLYSDKLIEKGFEYFYSENDNGNTIIYYKDKNTLISMAVVENYLSIGAVDY